MKQLNVTIAIICSIFILACSKPGPGGKGSIVLEVKSSKLSVDAAQVYLKYDTKTSPGTSADDYDQIKTTNPQGEVYFTNLHKGDYYVYATGFYDSLQSKFVNKGIAVEIKKKSEVVEKLIEMK